MSISIQYLIILNFLTPYNTLPHNLNREPRGLNEAENPLGSKVTEVDGNDDCSKNTGNREECLEESKYNQVSQKVMRCLNNCANCVKQWRRGVYNGHSCASDCMQQVEEPVESMDPDCNLVKYFNSTVLASV